MFLGALIVNGSSSWLPTLAQEVSASGKTEVEPTQSAEELWAAARKGDLEAVMAEVRGGVDVDTPTPYAATALSFAADRGHLEVVQYLLDAGANPNVQDTFYKATPLSWAISRNRLEIIRALAKAGAKDLGRALPKAITEKDVELVRLIAESKDITRSALEQGLKKADDDGVTEASELLSSTIADRFPRVEVPADLLNNYQGVYQATAEEGEERGETLRVGATETHLTARGATGRGTRLYAEDQQKFSVGKTLYEFVVQDGTVLAVVRRSEAGVKRFERLSKEAAEALPDSAGNSNDVVASDGKFPASSIESRDADLALSSSNWGQFRGAQARGIADGQSPPTQWDAADDRNLGWKTPIPGLGHSCPVVWDDRIYVTTAVSEFDTSIKTGLYGDVASVDDESVHKFVVMCLSASDGKVLWEKTACEKVPSVKRHLKSTHANSTVATDGRYVVTWFASEGIYCYKPNGELVWQRDLGLLDSGWFYDREYQWQFAASPVIDGDKVILQCDIQDDSFIAALDLTTGADVWRTQRDEIPSWSTPTVVQTPTGKQVITNATKAARAYDLMTGQEIWTIGGNSEIAVPTPFTAGGLIYVSSGYRPIQPIYAIRPDAQGELTLAKREKSSEHVAWSVSKGGPYMPTPLVYGDYLYTCNNSGILTCYQATSGELVYKKRLPMKKT
ncbi:MAG TPA: hypothetical protein DDW52_01615, partial [Planctomycetaceae bacterium]|nr:hypothetical protein [Planctomycetaceae bacterium]